MTPPALRVILGGLSRPLPRYWDGRKVAWGDWEPDMTTLRSHLDDERRACDGCGDVDGRLNYCQGNLLDENGDIHRDRRLYVFRCLSCGHDDVLDWGHDSWCLEPEDYGPNGSTPNPADHHPHEEDQ